jgi:hypothetical protein
MKLWKLVFFIFLTNSASAFFTNDAVEVLQKEVKIVVEGDMAHVEISIEFLNPTKKEQVFREIEPLEKGAVVKNFFVNMEGRPYSVIEEKERLEYLYQQAEITKDVRFFGFGANKYPTLFRSEGIILPAQQKVRTKKVFNIPIKIQDDFSFVQLYLEECVDTIPTEISFMLAEPVAHFMHSLDNSALVSTKNQTALLWSGTEKQAVSFYWSLVEEAEISMPYLGMDYGAKFVPPTKKDIQEITILIDRSGSLTGLPWQRTKDWTEFLLETFEDVRIRIGFFADGIEWHDEEFQINTFDFKKDFFSFLSGIAPVGKTDIIKALTGVRHGWTVDPENRLVFLLTDETTLGSDSNIFWDKEISETYVLLQFAENLDNDIAFFSKLSGGFPLKLFRSSPSLIEKTEFLKKLQLLNTKVVQPNEWEIQYKLPQFFPSKMRSQPFFFTGRTSRSSQGKNTSEAHFVPREWSILKIAEILQSFLSSRPQSFSQKEKEEKIDALLAIGRTFGVSTEFFNDRTTRSELEKKLKNVSRKNLMAEILRLENTPSSSPYEGENIRFLDGVPLYSYEKGWRQFNFPELARLETLIHIAPFSEAQKALFLQFPQFVAEGFGVASEVDFCTEFRCLSIREGEREVQKLSDRAFFKDYDENHWAHDYIVRAVKEGLLEPALNGKLHPNRPVDRAEFVVMVVKAFGLEQNLLSSPAKGRVGGVSFLDVHDPAYFDAVKILAQKGIIKGYPDGTFRPLQSLTRAEGVKILLSVGGWDPDPIPDPDPELNFSDVMGWEKPWVGEAVERGMVKGYGDGTFRPHNKLTRAEALKLIFEFFGSGSG